MKCRALGVDRVLDRIVVGDQSLEELRALGEWEAHPDPRIARYHAAMAFGTPVLHVPLLSPTAVVAVYSDGTPVVIRR